jgi:hypothetical protein
MFTCELTIDAGALEDWKGQTVEVGPKVSMASHDEKNRERGELNLDVTFDLLAEIIETVRQQKLDDYDLFTGS